MAEKVLEEAVAITLGDTKMIESRILSNEHPSSPEAEEIQKHYHNLKGKENLKKVETEKASRRMVTSGQTQQSRLHGGHSIC